VFKKAGFACALAVGLAIAQTPTSEQPGLKQRGATPSARHGTYRVEPGTHILLSMINSVSTKQAQPGDRLYLETAFPVIVNGKVVVPQGSYVTGTITEVKRAGRVKGKAEMQVRFDSLTLRNGVTRDFRADLGAIDGDSKETLNREQSKVNGDSNKTKEIETIGATTATGAAIGSTAGAIKNHWGRGFGIGTGAGAATGIAAVLMTRGPDASLARGSTVEMVLDRPLDFDESELAPANVQGARIEQQQQQQPSTEEAQPGFKRVRPF
jgi:type IV secretion system protein VirB10